MLQVTEVVKIRRKLLAEIARLTMEGELDKNNLTDILDEIVTVDGPRYRCCVHKERAVLKDRLKLAMAQPLDMGVSEATQRALAGEVADIPVINIMPEACDQCPIDKFLITNACRNCVAHNCIASCPKNAITVVHNQAYIDKSACIECGLCKKSCLYGAIVEITRPCERACELGAIKADKERRATIDYNKCVHCGGCKVACPFGAIGEQAYIVQIIQQMKAGKRVYAMLAPAFISQFGVKVKAGQVFNALKKAGFHDVREVSYGADIVILEEAKEFLEAVPEKQPFMTTSCCPAYVGMVEKHMPQMQEYVSTTVSPMVATATVIKNEDPEAITVFVGPCTAKKVEAKKRADVIDYAITFEEAMAMLVGANVEPAEQEEAFTTSSASRDGNNFARAGGVMQAVLNAAAEVAPDVTIKAQRAEGLHNCKMTLLQMKAGKLEGNFFEGMSCQGGCVGGPGILTDVKVSSKLVDAFAGTSNMKTALENKQAVSDTQKKEMHWHHKHQ